MSPRRTNQNPPKPRRRPFRLCHACGCRLRNKLDHCHKCGDRWNPNDWLIPRGEPIHNCLKCGYDLTTLPAPTCPECGTDNPTHKPLPRAARDRLIPTTRLFDAITREDHTFAGIPTARMSLTPLRHVVTERGSLRLLEWGLAPAFGMVLFGSTAALLPIVYTAGYAIQNPRVTLEDAFRELFSFVGFGAVAILIPIGVVLLLWGIAASIGCRWIEVSADRSQIQIGSWRLFRRRARTVDAETWSSHAWVQLAQVSGPPGPTFWGHTRNSTCYVVICAPSPDGIGDVVVYGGSRTEEAARALGESLVNRLPRTRIEPMRYIGCQPRNHRKPWTAFD